MPSRNATPSPVKLNIGKFKSDVSLWTNTNHRLSDNIIIEEDPEDDIGPKKNGPSFVGYFENVSLPSVIIGFVAVLFGLVIGLASVISALHRIQEGHVGIYYKYGALMDQVTQPGVHWMQPFVTEVVALRVTPETKVMDPMVCTTRDGVRNVFRDVQVISSLDPKFIHVLVKQFTHDLKYILVYDRVREAVQNFCANNSIDEVYNTRFLEIMDYVNVSLVRSLERFAPEGLILWNIFLPKPDVPPAIAANYRQVKVEWTEQLVAQQKQKTEKIRKETETMKAVLEAEKSKQVEAIRTAQFVEQEYGRANVSRIQNEIYEETGKMKADVSSYVDASQAESNKALLTDSYIKLEVAKMMANNSKMYFSGPDSLLGSALGQVFGNAINKT